MRYKSLSLILVGKIRHLCSSVVLPIWRKKPKLENIPKSFIFDGNGLYLIIKKKFFSNPKPILTILTQVLYATLNWLPHDILPLLSLILHVLALKATFFLIKN